ncbi:MAG: diguanylate cyclase [Lachnospiraceae bacterium]|nr:diguanylate cyclase [Lachnospiraceae bacterium]
MNEISTTDIHELEARERKAVVQVMLSLVIACVFLDTGFFIFYYVTDAIIRYTVMEYIIVRVLAPFSVNLLSYLVAVIVNEKCDVSEKTRTYVCCFSLLTIAGSMAFFHSFFLALLCGPALCMTFSTIFHDRSLMVFELLYCLLILFFAGLWIVAERPEDAYYYIQQIFVAMCITLLFSLVCFSMEAYSNSVVAVVRTSNTMQEEYKERLDVDFLTGVFSRSYFQAEAVKMLERATAENPVTFAVIDIDNFKSVNDTYGHENGDEVLVTLGKLMKDYNSYKCLTGRYGGEEFVFIFEGDDAKTHRRTLEEIRECFSLQHYSFMDRTVTFSCGMITIYQPENFESVFAKADQNLYISKGKGKNCVTA